MWYRPAGRVAANRIRRDRGRGLSIGHSKRIDTDRLIISHRSVRLKGLASFGGFSLACISPCTGGNEKGYGAGV